MNAQPKVTIITPTTGNPILKRNIESVANQSYKNIQHLIVIDGPEHLDKVTDIFSKTINDVEKYSHIDLIKLPYSVGKDRWNGHRIYASGCFLAEGEYLVFLDEDNYLDPNHISDCLDTIQRGNQWAFSLRKIVGNDGAFICNDDCENLGKWPSILDKEDYFVDVNCYFLPKLLAIHIASLWYRKAREPGVPEVDRIMSHTLRRITDSYDCTYKYSVNYTVGNTVNSVQAEFFRRGNLEMNRRYNGKFPWKKEQ